MKKFTGEVSLTGQAFVMDPSVSVGDFLKSVNTSVSNFIRLEVGEGIEKKKKKILLLKLQKSLAVTRNSLKITIC